MWKKVIVFMIACCVLLSLSLVTFAAPSDEINISPRYTYINSSTTGLTISGNSATVSAKIVGIANLTTRVEVYAYLQQYSGGSWKTVGSWSQSANALNTTLQKQKTVEKGYTYRVKASYYSYAGSKSENIVEYSKEVTY